MELHVGDDFVREVFGRAKELGLLHAAETPAPWLTTEQAAVYLGCSEGQVLNHVSAGHIPRRYRKGHKARFKTSDLDAYVEGRAA